MGKKKITTMDNDKPKAKKEMFRWEEAYTDLSSRVASALREARLKPEQITSMADGELLSLEGIDSAAVEEIRANYPVNISPAKETKKEVVQEETKKASTHPSSRYPRVRFGRSATYKAKKELLKVDVYPLSTAVKMLREVSYGKHKTVEMMLNTKEEGVRGEITLPHSVGKETKVAIFNKEIEAEIKAGKINFDILLAKPQDMPVIAPLAKVLGPKGLMPNPKTNTIVADPENRKAELEKGSTLAYKTAAKQKIIHLAVGNLDQKDKELIENLTVILNGIGLAKLNSAYLKSTMSPSLKIDLNKLA